MTPSVIGDNVGVWAFSLMEEEGPAHDRIVWQTSRLGQIFGRANRSKNGGAPALDIKNDSRESRIAKGPNRAIFTC